MDLDEKYEESCRLIERGKFDEAISILDEIISQNSEQYFAINKKGVALANKNDLNEAESIFKRCLEVNPDYAPALVNLGNLQRQRGQLENAINYYNMAIELDPEYHYSYYNLASVYKSQKNFNEYFKYIKKYKRTYRHHIIDTKKDIANKFNENKNKKYLAAFVFACIIIGMVLIGSHI